MKKKVVVVGGGINGLVAANYLTKEGCSVSLIEKKEKFGGACTHQTKIIGSKKIEYAQGATVLGMMPDFIFNETGLSKKIKIYAPKHPKLVYFPGSHIATKIYQDHEKLNYELKSKWNEKGDLKKFRSDESRVVDYIRKGYKKAESPSIGNAENELGNDLVELWIKGSAKNLLDHYFTSDKTKIYMGMTCIESGASSIHNKGTAFTIPLMDSGSIFDGYWGYVKGGIWKIIDEISEINNKIGVELFNSSKIININNDKSEISFRQNNKNHLLNYDYLVFATDPLTPSKLLGNNSLLNEFDGKDFLGTSGKITAFFNKPVIWKEKSNYKNSDTAFRFIFSNDCLDDFESSSQKTANGENDYNPSFIQVYAEGAAQRLMKNKEPFDKLVFFTKNLSHKKNADDLTLVKDQIMRLMYQYIENPENCVGTEFLSPKDLTETFYFPEGNIDHMALNKNQNYNNRNFSKNPKKSFYLYGEYDNIYYCGAGAYPCGSVAGTPGYMCAMQLLKN